MVRSAKSTVAILTPDFLISTNDKQQPDPLIPFCEIVRLGWALGTSSDSSLSKFISYTHLCLIALG